MSARSPKGFIAHLNPIALIRDLFVQRGLLWQFTVRNFEARHKGSYLGIAWAVLEPLLMLGLYFVVWSLIFKGHFSGRADETPADFALALLVGLTVFRFLADIVAQSPALIVGSPNLVKRVVFPVEVLPMANLGACFVSFVISLALVVLGLILFDHGLSSSALWLPALVLPLLLLAAGLGWFLAALGVFFRDVSQVTQFLTILLMYTSTVFYPSSMVRDHAPKVWAVLRFNPVIHAIEPMRDVLLWHRPVDLANLGWLYAVSTVTCLVGYACFATLRPTFSDVL